MKNFMLVFMLYFIISLYSGDYLAHSWKTKKYTVHGNGLVSFIDMERNEPVVICGTYYIEKYDE